MIEIHADEVMREADLVAKDAQRRLARAELLLHERGYGKYSAAVSNMRVKIERANIELVEEVENL
jgi:F0F1-type ATP synthase epsilon subunit